MSHDPSKIIPPSPSDADYRALRGETQEEERDLPPEGEDPFAIFAQWLALAVEKEPNDPNAMTLATVGADGMPDARMVLLKDVSRGGFVFYTNLESRKGRQLAEIPRAALVFHWKSLRRQVRVQGGVERVGDAEADAYFASRARDSRIGAWASDQSRPMEEPLALEKRVAAYAAKFALGDVPRPPHWSGFRLIPVRIEFWKSMPFRLHQRRVFERVGAGWRESRLFP